MRGNIWECAVATDRDWWCMHCWCVQACQSACQYSLWSPFRWNATLPSVARWHLCAGRPDGTPAGRFVSHGSSPSLSWLPRPSTSDCFACRPADTNAPKSGMTSIWKRYACSSTIRHDTIRYKFPHKNWQKLPAMSRCCKNRIRNTPRSLLDAYYGSVIPMK